MCVLDVEWLTRNFSPFIVIEAYYLKEWKEMIFRVDDFMQLKKSLSFEYKCINFSNRYANTETRKGVF